MAQKFGTARLFGQIPPAATPQEQVNLQILHAIELLGARLERAESERDRLAQRLAMIESHATVDEKTGKLYLPVVVDPQARQQPVTPRWTVAASLASSAIALCALGLALYRAPETMPLSPAQVAAVNNVVLPASARLPDVGHGPWQRVEDIGKLEPAAGGPLEPRAEEPRAEEKPAAEQVAAAAPQLPSHMYAEIFGPPQPPKAPVAELKKPEPVVEAKPVKPAVAEAKSVEKAPAPKVEAPVPLVAEAKPAEKQEKPDEKTAAVASGDIGPDPALPAKLADIERRAFSGAPEAQHDLATIYAAGKAVPQDYKRAAYWFYKAADGGIANADYNLGVMFQQGLGVHKDVNKALGWYEKAAQLGHPEAMYNLGIAYVEGVGTTRNIERGVSFFKKAANAGVAQAAYNLGILYESSFVGPIDLAKAVEWYQVAANEGNTSAKDAITRLKQQIAEANRTGEKGEKVATAVEPAAGGEEQEYGEGDSTPMNESIARLSTDIVVKTQEALISHGDISGKPTGIVDDKTAAAIRDWQAKLGLPVTGQPSQQLLERLHAAISDRKQ